MAKKTIETIQVELTRCTDPKQYDTLKGQVEALVKAASIENALRLAEIDEIQRKEREDLQAEHARRIAVIQRLYSEIEAIDVELYELARKMAPAAERRLALSAEALQAEIEAEISGDRLGQPYTRRAAAFFGGQPFFKDAHSLIKTHLQRVESWAARLGGYDRLTAEVVGSHGLEGGTEAADLPNRY